MIIMMIISSWESYDEEDRDEEDKDEDFADMEDESLFVQSGDGLDNIGQQWSNTSSACSGEHNMPCNWTEISKHCRDFLRIKFHDDV